MSLVAQKLAAVAQKTDKFTCRKVTHRQLPNYTSCPGLKNAFLDPGLGTELPLVARYEMIYTILYLAKACSLSVPCEYGRKTHMLCQEESCPTAANKKTRNLFGEFSNNNICMLRRIYIYMYVYLWLLNTQNETAVG